MEDIIFGNMKIRKILIGLLIAILFGCSISEDGKHIQKNNDKNVKSSSITHIKFLDYSIQEKDISEKISLGNKESINVMHRDNSDIYLNVIDTSKDQYLLSTTAILKFNSERCDFSVVKDTMGKYRIWDFLTLGDKCYYSTIQYNNDNLKYEIIKEENSTIDVLSSGIINEVQRTPTFSKNDENIYFLEEKLNYNDKLKVVDSYQMEASNAKDNNEIWSQSGNIKNYMRTSNDENLDSPYLMASNNLSTFFTHTTDHDTVYFIQNQKIDSLEFKENIINVFPTKNYIYIGFQNGYYVYNVHTKQLYKGNGFLSSGRYEYLDDDYFVHFSGDEKVAISKIEDGNVISNSLDTLNINVYSYFARTKENQFYIFENSFNEEMQKNILKVHEVNFTANR